MSDERASGLYMEHRSWTAIFVASYLLFGVVTSFVFRRERTAAKGDDRDRGSLRFIMIMSALGIVLAIAAPIVVPAARIDLPSLPLFIVSIVVFWAGAGLYTWSVVTLGKWFRPSVQIFEDQRLVTSGPYRILRHPAYTGGILVFAGIGLSFGNWLSFICATLAVTLAYAWRIRIEEAALVERFGAEFEARRKRTWAVLPPIW
jgi:protein-S-isoprenylcysteine O-methyltransferase Ste14